MKKKMKKTEGKLQFFIFWKIAIFLEFVFHFFSFFFHFFHFFIIFHHFSSFFINSTTGSKNDKKMIKNDKEMKKTRGKLQFSIFYFFFSTMEEKMIKK